MPREDGEFLDFSGQLIGGLEEYILDETLKTVNPYIRDAIYSDKRAFGGLTEVRKYVPGMSPYEKEKIKQEEKERQQKEKEEAASKELEAAKAKIEKEKQKEAIKKKQAETGKAKSITTKIGGDNSNTKPPTSTFKPGGEK